MKKIPRIILASRSPARRKLMEQLGIPFECHAGSFVEDMNRYKNPAKLAQFLASGKAGSIASKFPDSIIIGADTFGTVDKAIIGKPGSYNEAEKMIGLLGGNTVYIHTGLSLLHTDANGKPLRELVSHTVTKLVFAKLSRENIREIIEKDDVLNVAGALTIEGESGKYVETIDGDYHNVIGLPLFRLREMLMEFGVKTT